MKTRATNREGGWDRRDWQRALRPAELVLVCAASCLFRPEAASGAGSVQLAWDPNAEPDIAGYRVYYGTFSRAYSQWLDAGNVTNATVTSLANQTSYYFAVTAWNTAGLESDYSITQVNGVLTVTPAALVSIAVTEATNTITVGQSQQATATGTYTEGTSQDVSTAAAWLSSAPSVATVNSAGLVNALAVGNTVISASLSGVEGSAALAVVASTPVTYTNTVAFTQSKAITIPAIGAATPYPSTIQVSGLAGTVQKVCVTLRSFSHTAPEDVNVLLVSPANNKCLLMANCGGTRAATGVALTFDDAATALLPNSSQIRTGTYKPTFYGNSAILPSPAPAGPYVSSLSAINGTTPVGTWSLYVADDAAKNSGSLYAGWSLTITTVCTVSSGTAMMVHGPPSPGASEDQLLRPPGIATATSLNFGSMVLLPDGKVKLGVRGQPGQAYTLQVSTDLVHWWNLSAGVVPSGEFDFVDQPASRGSASFYRLQAGTQSPLE
jgi:subtilisin-like proprotein convertase family protein